MMACHRDALFLYFNNYTHILYYLETTFLPPETVFRTQHLLDLHKEPVPDWRKEQLLPRKVIQTLSPKVLRDLKVLSIRRT